MHVLALCRGDFANDTACADCVATSFQHAQQTCPNDKDATVYYDYDDINNQRPGCVLGFSGNGDFLSPAAGITENERFSSLGIRLTSPRTPPSPPQMSTTY